MKETVPPSYTPVHRGALLEELCRKALTQELEDTVQHDRGFQELFDQAYKQGLLSTRSNVIESFDQDHHQGGHFDSPEAEHK